jgi:MATE family multidrug resistance protein
MISTGFWSIQWFVDRMYLMWYSSDAMTAALPAGMVHWTMICFPVGIASYVNTFVAQYFGAGHRERIGLAVAQGVRFGWILTPLFLLSVPLAPWMLGSSGATKAISRLSIVYFQILAVGAGGTVIGNAMSSYYTGRGLTRVVMIVQGLATLVNIVLDYMLVFGKGGLPEMGIAGAAWATVVSQWFTVGAFWLLMRQPQERREFGLDEGNRLDAPLLWRLLRFGAPGGLPMLIEAASFTLLTVFVSQIGKVEAAATSVAFNVNAIAFIPVYGVSIAVSTLVGQKLGEGRTDLALRATWTALWLALAYTGFFGALYVGLPDLFLAAHGAFADARAFAEVRLTTIVLLRFVAAYCLFDTVQIIFVGALKGAGDTRFVLAATSAIAAVSVIVGRAGQLQLGWGLYGWWWVLTAWLLALSMAYLARILGGKWLCMRVIETEYLTGKPASQAWETPAALAADPPQSSPS